MGPTVPVSNSSLHLAAYTFWSKRHREADFIVSMLPYRRVIDWNHGMGKLIDPQYRVPDEWDWDWKLE